MQASIQLANATTNQWVINITDTTSMQSFQIAVVYNSSQLSAEWIVERPAISRSLTLSSLADFGNMTFSNCTATIGGVVGNINSFPYDAITMYSSNTPGNTPVQLTEVSDLSPDGSEFTVSWLD